MMSEQDRKKMQELDAAAEKAGGFVDFVFDKIHITITAKSSSTVRKKGLNRKT